LEWGKMVVEPRFIDETRNEAELRSLILCIPQLENEIQIDRCYIKAMDIEG
jgi:hypothetical protein